MELKGQNIAFAILFKKIQKTVFFFLKRVGDRWNSIVLPQKK